MNSLKYFKIIFAFCWVRIKQGSRKSIIQRAKGVNERHLFDGDIVQLLINKGYLPKDKDLPNDSIVKTSENDANYILSKLPDEELLKLLNAFPKRVEYDMDDIIKVSADFKNNQRDELKNAKRVQNEPKQAIFRLENKEVDPFTVNKDADPKYNALQKLNNMLYSRPHEDISAENLDKKEMLFDILVSQLKTLCCKRNKQKKSKVTEIKEMQPKKQIEYIFLVVNDEIKSNMSDELIRVDPDSLSKNSSVLLLGPITKPLTDIQTKLVINRISKELSKPEYLPLLNKISEGDLGKKNSNILKSLISGPETRRYIKPHRCNHQSKLSKVYGGPKWIICTGYLNINTPSLYD